MRHPVFKSKYVTYNLYSQFKGSNNTDKPISMKIIYLWLYIILDISYLSSFSALRTAGA